MIVQTKKISQREIEWRTNLFNGGYRQYWGLYAQLLTMLKDMEALAEKIRELHPRFPKWKINVALFKVYAMAYTWTFVWICLLKPLGQFWSRTVLVEGTYQVVDGVIENKDIRKSTSHKLFRVTIFTIRNQKLNKEELDKL